MDKYQDVSQTSYEEVFKSFEKLMNKRVPYEAVWDTITEYVMPSRGSYAQRDVRTSPERKSKRRLESTPTIAHRKMYSKIVSEMTGSGSRWFDFRVSDPAVDQLDVVRRFLQLVSDKVYGIFNASAFRMAHVEATADWAGYGTACVFLQKKEDRLVPKSIPVTQLYVEENDLGAIDTVYRKFMFTNKQAEEFFGLENLPPSVQIDCEHRPFDELEVVHAVYVNSDYDASKKRNIYFKFKSCFGLPKTRAVVGEGFYKRQPYVVFRFWKRSDEVYGGSPAMDALSDIRLLNALEEERLRAIQLRVRPPMGLAHDSVVAPMKLVPGGVNYGALTSDGKRLVDRLFDGDVDLNALEVVMDQKRNLIYSAFFVDPLANRETSIRTAAEVNVRGNEIMIGVAPFLNRYEVEYLTPMLNELLQHVLETDKSLVVPRELNGLLPTIEYTAPLAKTQRAQELTANMQFLQVVQGLAQVFPDIVTRLDDVELLPELADLMGVSLKLLKSQRQVVAEKQAQAAQAQAQSQLQGLQGAASTMSELSKSGLINRSDLGLPPEV